MINLKFTKDHWIALSGVIVGSLIAISIPLWQVFWVETPKLGIDVIY
ncbi:hypothetical protein [Pseudoalteromonas xiamenensis]